MPDVTQKKLRRATVIYWMLLTYIVAALVWWFISLERQALQMREFKTLELKATIDSVVSPELYRNEILKVEKEYSLEKAKYIGEGSVFLLLIVIGSVFVYRSINRQLKFHQQQQNFMMAVTHELKTPISITRLNLETLQKYNLDPEKQKKLIRTTLEETSRLNFLTNNILISSQLEGGGYTFSKEEIDLSRLTKDCMQAFRERFPDRIFREDIEAEIDFKADALLIQILINNIVENAIKYSPKEKPITASLKNENSKILLQITDEGEGIPDEEKKKIFTKFYRIGNEATRRRQGTGLGLYLCAIIARDHNADISVTNNTPSGSNFAVIFHKRTGR